jgi:integrase
VLHYGCRKGELLNAKWEHVDRDNRVLVIPKTKTGRAYRFPLDAIAFDVFDKLNSRGDGSEWPTEGWLFPAPHGGSGRVTGENAAWIRIRNRAGVGGDHAYIHTLRSTHLTDLAAKGYSASQIQLAGNHSTLAMADKYVKLVAIDISKMREDERLASFKRVTVEPTRATAVAEDDEIPCV